VTRPDIACITWNRFEQELPSHDGFVSQGFYPILTSVDGALIEASVEYGSRPISKQTAAPPTETPKCRQTKLTVTPSIAGALNGHGASASEPPTEVAKDRQTQLTIT
jgi:hypothetical protein